MSKYFKYTPSQNQITTLRFIDDGASGCNIKHFDTHCLVADGTAEGFAYLTSAQPVEIGYTEIQFDEFYALAQQSTQARFETANLEKKFNTSVSLLTKKATSNEMATWGKQEQRAREFLANPTAPSPQLQKLIEARAKGETIEQLALKIVAGADFYELEGLKALGAHQALKMAIYNVAQKGL